MAGSTSDDLADAAHIASIAVSSHVATVDDTVTIRVEGDPGRRGQFSIPGARSAFHLPLEEDPPESGKYVGLYRVEPGDDVRDAPIVAVLTSRDGRTTRRSSDVRITVVCVPPAIADANLNCEAVTNGDSLTLSVSATPGSRLVVDLSELDTTREEVFLAETPEGSGAYRGRIRISKRNTAINGLKRIGIKASDRIADIHSDTELEVNLRNSELTRIPTLDVSDAKLLNEADVLTLADLRRIDPVRLAEQTGLSTDSLQRLCSSASLQAMGVEPDIAHVLVNQGGIGSISDLALADTRAIDTIVETAIESGILAPEKVGTGSLSAQLVGAAISITRKTLERYRGELKSSIDTCKTDCGDELSVFGCHAYLLELVEITGLTWDQLGQKFKQDFLAVDTRPTTRIGIAVAVLERALSEDLGDPSRRTLDWIDYDQTLNRLLDRMLVEVLNWSASKLRASFPDAYALNRSLAERNSTIETILAGLKTNGDYHQALVGILENRTALSGAALAARYPQAFSNTYTQTQRSEALEKLLGLASTNQRIAKVKSEIASLELQALVAQSRKTEHWLRDHYFISFSPEDCSETSTCRQAILTLQEYLAKKAFTDPRYEYPTYDRWRLEQVEDHFPENIYVHEFKRSLIRGKRALLAEHLKKARVILDSVRVSVGGQRPQQDDLLNSFDWRNPYYGNLASGLQMVKDCHDIDDLMVKGHNAYFSEEHATARQYYLQAAEKIRSTSKQFSKAMGDALLPLWSEDQRDSYFARSPVEAAKAAKDFFEKTLLSFSEKNKPGVQLASGQIALKGVDSQGSFAPMAKNGLDTTIWQQVDITDQMNTTPTVSVMPSGALTFKGKGEGTYATRLVYTPGKQWTDLAVEVDCQGEYLLGTGFRYGTSPGWSYVQNINGPTFDYSAFILDAKNTFEKKAIKWRGNVPYRIRVEANKHSVSASLKWWNASASHWEPVTSIPVSGSAAPIGIPGLGDSGTLALYANGGSQLARPSITRLAVWDLSSASGAVADRAFLLPPRSTPLTNTVMVLYLIYSLRPYDLGTTPGNLARALSVSYDDQDWIITRPLIDEDSLDPTVSRDKGFFDGFHQEAGTSLTGLWYDQGDARLNRANLRELLDGMVMLLCHQYFFLLPLCLGDVANAIGQFDEARTWYRLIYDDRKPLKQRPVYPYLRPGCEDEMMRIRHASNYVDWADFKFNQNTEESVQEARRLYGHALRTMGTELCCQKQRRQNDIVVDLGRSLLPLAAHHPAVADNAFRSIASLISKAASVDSARALLSEIRLILDGDSAWPAKADGVDLLIAEKVAPLAAPLTLSMVVRGADALKCYLAKIERQSITVLDGVERAIRWQASDTRVVSASLVSPRPVSTSLVSASDDEGEPLTRDAISQSLSLQAEVSMTSDSVPSAWEGNPLLPYGSAVGASPYSIPMEAFEDTAAKADLERIGPLVGLPVSRVPLDPRVPGTVDPSRLKRALPAWVKSDLCVPLNPVIDALTRRACLGIYHIDHCFNALGFPQADISCFRFEYLVTMARNFAQMALSAEKDFIQFKTQFEKDTLELMSASQAASISKAGFQLAQLRLNEALDQVTGAYLGIEKVNAQIAAVENRIDELGSGLSVVSAILGGAATAVSSGNLTAALLSTASSGLGYLAGLEENEESLQMQLQVLSTADYNAASLNLMGAMNAQQSARQQALIADLESKFVAEKASLLASEFFNPQLWNLLAREVKKNYRVYLNYGTIAAWLAQRALEFERGMESRRSFASSGMGSTSTSVSIVRFDYFQPSQQGLLGADTLLRDIATLENEKYLNEQRKMRITKVISLANLYPFLFVRFLETGVLPFSTTLEAFDEDYAGHYQRRIQAVRVNLTGLIGQEGIKATLTCLGNSWVVVRQMTEVNGKQKIVFSSKPLRRAPETVALTNPQGGGLTKSPLVSKDVMLNPFEGHGVATRWLFEMPRHANDIDFDTITDVQILIDYTSLMDSAYARAVLERLPRRRHAMRTFSFRLDFPDALFHLKDAPLPLDMVETVDGTTGAYTLMLETRDGDLGHNQVGRKLSQATLYIRSKGQELTSLKIKVATRSWLTSQNANWKEADLVPASFYELDTPAVNSPDHVALKPHYLGTRKSSQDGITQAVIDRWYLYFSPDVNPAFLKTEGGNPVLVNGSKVFDFSSIKDAVFGLDYSYVAALPEV